MKERPILFSAPMVRAILAGTKTQTRRVLPTMETLGRIEYPGRRDRTGHSMVNWLDTPEGIAAAVRECRYGQPGDRLWVRETWARDDEDGSIMYRADVGHDMNADAWEQGRLEGVPRYRWRPSIHMPRWASRITLELTGVRVERLQDISEADARAEGVRSNRDTLAETGFATCRDAFRDIWSSINGPGSWEANPWVWCIEFRRVTSD